jgi:hypothetical protein
MASQKLIDAVIKGVILDEYSITGNGTYRITKIASVSQGARNQPDGYYQHVFERGGTHKNSSFYGSYDSFEEAAEAIIKNRRIVAVDDSRRAVFGKKDSIKVEKCQGCVFYKENDYLRCAVNPELPKDCQHFSEKN